MECIFYSFWQEKRSWVKEAVTRRFFIVFEYEPIPGGSKKNEEKDAITQLEVAERTARTYLMQCGNNVVEHDDPNSFMAEVLYTLLNRKTSAEKSFSERATAEVGKHVSEGDANSIPISAFILPEQMDFRKAGYSIIDGLYYAYFMIPSNGYKPQVTAGWLSLLVNAGEGIDVDIFLSKEPKEKIQFQLGRQIRINRSKMKETSDTNTDFDDIDSAVRSGYYLKDGLANNQDFYYINTLITITADSAEELEWRTNEMKKLMLSQDLILKPCYFRQDLAFQSVLPINKLHKSLHELSKRNVLTTGAASCYPFVSFEMSDDNGILLGVNKYNIYTLHDAKKEEKSVLVKRGILIIIMFIGIIAIRYGGRVLIADMILDGFDTTEELFAEIDRKQEFRATWEEYRKEEMANGGPTYRIEDIFASTLKPDHWKDFFVLTDLPENFYYKDNEYSWHEPGDHVVTEIFYDYETNTDFFYFVQAADFDYNKGHLPPDIKKEEGTLYKEEKGVRNQIIWFYGDITLYLEGNISMEELEKAAKNAVNYNELSYDYSAIEGIAGIYE